MPLGGCKRPEKPPKRELSANRKIALTARALGILLCECVQRLSVAGWHWCSPRCVPARRSYDLGWLQTPRKTTETRAQRKPQNRTDRKGVRHLALRMRSKAICGGLALVQPKMCASCSVRCPWVAANAQKNHRNASSAQTAKSH